MLPCMGSNTQQNKCRAVHYRALPALKGVWCFEHMSEDHVQPILCQHLLVLEPPQQILQGLRRMVKDRFCDNDSGDKS